jgi:hypothetical protein
MICQASYQGQEKPHRHDLPSQLSRTGETSQTWSAKSAIKDRRNLTDMICQVSY